ncbi:MAG: DNA mismatch repair endonuclease MutL [Gemmatimonadales bacterium]|nr:DNA mismatch repair endonuclease MutL [Gemmatimonadales bacterium]MDQ3427908.1 DNA mismatch repair endonuclease MutL [Gemmatimonadota bacterium]
MPRRISILPDAVADQIAAGEVVERPASVVKELVENALDAGARHVRVELEQGGKILIQVSDDGSGMGREDAVLAVDRHATSKVRSVADLVGVATFGFRGEALPAIASVSRFTLTTHDGEGTGTELSISGGRVERVTDSVRQRGTTVTVRALFFNTPARRKFLRSVASEARAAHDAVATLALAHAEAGFELEVDATLRLAVPPGQEPEERLAAVWGRDVAGTLIPVAYAAGAFRVEGFVQRPADAKPTGRRTQLFVNGRPFKDPFLVRAAEAGYRSAIHPGDRPSVYLRVEVAPGEVDVNVHPAKLEVRFRDRIGVERVVEEAVRHGLGALVAAAPVGQWRALVPGGVEASPPGRAADLADLFAPGEQPTPAAALPQESGAGFQVPLLQAFDTYIVYEAPEGIVIVDQHSAHERVLYEAVLAQLSGSGAPAQRLLLPLTLELTDEELDAVEVHGAELRRIGFEAEAFGGRTVVVHAVPSPHPRFDAGACFREVIADLARGRFGGWANRLERFAATYACRAAVKAGDRLEQPEMRELLLRLFATDLPPHDVHGRATIVQLPREELERRFGRR